MKKRHAWSDYLQYLIVRLAAMILGVISIETNRRMMRWLGDLWFRLPDALPETRIPPSIARLRFMSWSVKLSQSGNKLLNKFREHRRRAERHVRTSFPEYSEVEVAATVRASMQQLAMLAIEVLMTPRLITTWTWARHLKLRELDEAIRILLGRKGCIMLTGHYGNWELLGHSLAVLGFDILAVMRPLDNEYLNR